MHIKKYMKGLIVICVVVMIIIVIIWWFNGWHWKLPETLVNSVSMETMASNFDLLKENGYQGGDVIPGFYMLTKPGNPGFLVTRYDNGDSDAAESEVKYEAYTTSNPDYHKEVVDDFMEFSADYRFMHIVVLQNNKGRIDFLYFSNRMIRGQREAKEYLETFLQTYCQ